MEIEFGRDSTFEEWFLFAKTNPKKPPSAPRVRLRP